VCVRVYACMRMCVQCMCVHMCTCVCMSVSVEVDSEPQAEEIGLKRFTTAKISDKFSRESP